jgi:hypothetical protein
LKQNSVSISTTAGSISLWTRWSKFFRCSRENPGFLKKWIRGIDTSLGEIARTVRPLNSNKSLPDEPPESEFYVMGVYGSRETVHPTETVNLIHPADIGFHYDSNWFIADAPHTRSFQHNVILLSLS